MKFSEAQQHLNDLEKVLNVSTYPDSALPAIKAAIGNAWDDVSASEPD